MTTNQKKMRLDDIDRAKGLAIFLVVLGHLWAPGAAPEGVSTYLYIKELIYKFHMPFFMFLSGVIFYYTYKQVDTIPSYLQYAANKFKRLIPAYLVFGAAILGGKLLFSQFVPVDNTNSDFLRAAFDIVITPGKSVAGSLWYIYVLLQLYLILPIFLHAVRNNSALLLTFSVIAHFLPSTQYFMIDKLFEYILYFSVGIVAIKHYIPYTDYIDRHSKGLVLLFAASFLSIHYTNAEVSKLIIGICSIPAIHSIIRHNIFKNINILYLLGEYSFSIYLINTIVIGTTKALTLELFLPSGPDYFVLSLSLLLAGIVLPIMIKRYVFVHLSFMKRITS